MKTKMTCAALLLACGLLTAVGAEESYRFKVDTASRIGSADLDAGNYKVVVGGPKVILTEVKTGKVTELAATVAQADRKFDTTEIHTQQVDGVSKIREIRFGGSKTKITFE